MGDDQEIGDNANASKEGVCDTNDQEEVEEGELSDEEESHSSSAPQSSTAVRSVQEKPTNHQLTSHKNDHSSSGHHHHGHHGSTSESFKPSTKDKLSSDHLTNRSSPKKRRHESEMSKPNEDKFESFFKKRKEELAEKVRNQLRLAGIEATVESGSESDPDCIKPDLMENLESPVARKRIGSKKSDRTSSKAPKYYDLDKIEDPTETMLSNWASKGKLTTASSGDSTGAGAAVGGPSAKGIAAGGRLAVTDAVGGSASPDPYDEYYGASAPAAEETLTSTSTTVAVVAGGQTTSASVDQDFRRLPLTSASTTVTSTPTTNTTTAMTSAGSGADQDYRLNPGYDVDYRRKRRNGEAGGTALPSTHDQLSGGESSELGGYASDVDADGNDAEPRRRRRGRRGVDDASSAAANEFGDIDERKGSASDGRRSGASGAVSRRQPEFRRGGEFEAGRSGSESGDENEDMRPPFRPYRQDYGKFNRQRSPFRRRGLGRFDGFGRPGSDNPPICRYFKEGYCREGENCLYNHNFEQQPRGAGRIRELCRFYKFGYCRNGRTCPYMHGDFPCKDFHKSSSCKEGENCRFSHDPLTDWTKPLFERMVRDEEAFNSANTEIHHKAASHLPEIPSRRKVLLGEPPRPLSHPHPSNGPVMDMSHGMSNDSYIPSPHHSFNASSNYPGADSSFNASFDDRPPLPHPALHPHPHHYPGGPMMPPLPPVPPQQPVGFYPDPQKHMNSVLSNFAPQNNNSPSGHVTGADQRGRVDTVESQASTPSIGGAAVDIATMLRQIKAEVRGQQDTVDESPASPEPCHHDSATFNPTPLRQTVVRTVEYRLIPFDFYSPDQSYAQSLLKLSLTDTKLSNDPRIKKMLTNQFDAVSDLISSSQKVTSQSTAPKARDPRLKAGPDAPNQRDTPPRPTGGGHGLLMTPPIPPAMLDAASLPTNPHMAMFFSNALPPTNQSLAPPINGQQHMHHHQQQQNLFVGLQNFMHHQQPINNGQQGVGWMPQMGTAYPGHQPANPQQPLTNLPPRYATTPNPTLLAPPSFFDPPTNQSELLRHTRPTPSNRPLPSVRQSPPSFYGGGNCSPPSPAYQPLNVTRAGPKIETPTAADQPQPKVATFNESTNQEFVSVKVEPTSTNQNCEAGVLDVSATNQNDARSSPGPASLSLREKRKNLEYESPLSSVSSTNRASTDENVRYYGYNVKIKKKEAAES